jgi:HEAT repeat protein
MSSDLPWEDQADLEEVHNASRIMIGDIEISVRVPGDPRYDLLDAIRRRDVRVAQRMVTADELLDGLRHGSEIVRGEAAIRLRARHADNRQTIPALIALLSHDPSGDVRFLATMQLGHFGADPRVRTALEAARQSDTDGTVREEAEWALNLAVDEEI